MKLGFTERNLNVSRPEGWRKVVECATEGCSAKFERNSPRHKYCAKCAEERYSGYNHKWYWELGGKERKKEYYEKKKNWISE